MAEGLEACSALQLMPLIDRDDLKGFKPDWPMGMELVMPNDLRRILTNNPDLPEVFRKPPSWSERGIEFMVDASRTPGRFWCQSAFKLHG